MILNSTKTDHRLRLSVAFLTVNHHVERIGCNDSRHHEEGQMNTCVHELFLRVKDPLPCRYLNVKVIVSDLISQYVH